MKQETAIQMREWFISELKDLTKKVMDQEEKRQAKVKEKVLKKLGDYRTYSDLQDAYGCGVITERQFDRLADLIEKSEPYPDELYEAKIALLTELYREQKEFLEKDRKWEAQHEQ